MSPDSKQARQAEYTSFTEAEAPDIDEQMEAYSQAVDSGQYDKRAGLRKKYDNVRLYWEDELTRQWLQPHLGRLIDRRRAELRRLRILDLGCGSGDGFELVTGIRERNPTLTAQQTHLLTDQVLEYYKGVDLSEPLLQQAEQVHGDKPKMEFVQGDFCEGLPVEEGEPAYDLYFTSYGTLSHHNDDETLVEMLADIARHVDDYALILGDWLGRYSYEWQQLWTDDYDELRNMDYVISYIYDEEERELRRDELEHIYLRLMTRDEITDCIERAGDAAGAQIRLLDLNDRSVFTGRHMDTAEYNEHATAIRQAVNSLHEANLRTDLNDLYIDYVPKKGFPFLNSFFNELQMSWNTLITSAERMLTNFDTEQEAIIPEPEIPDSYPAPLKKCLNNLAQVINGTGWISVGLTRENVIEPQIGYLLRHLVSSMQRGMGCAHGIVGVFEVDKT